MIAGEAANVDSPRVIGTVDGDLLAVRRRGDAAVENTQRFHAFDFDCAKNVSIDGIHYQRDIHALLVAEILETKYGLAAPAAAALGLAADTETRALGMSILAPTRRRVEILPDVDIFPQFRGKVEHLGPEQSSVGRLIEQRCKLADFIQQFRRFLRVAQVQDHGPTEQILEIECCGAHGQVTESLTVLWTYPSILPHHLLIPRTNFPVIHRPATSSCYSPARISPAFSPCDSRKSRKSSGMPAVCMHPANKIDNHSH